MTGIPNKKYIFTIFSQFFGINVSFYFQTFKGKTHFLPRPIHFIQSVHNRYNFKANLILLDFNFFLNVQKHVHNDQLLPVHLFYTGTISYMYIDILIHSDTKNLDFISTIKKFDIVYTGHLNFWILSNFIQVSTKFTINGRRQGRWCFSNMFITFWNQRLTW